MESKMLLQIYNCQILSNMYIIKSFNIPFKIISDIYVDNYSILI